LPRILPAARFEDFIARADGYDMILLPTLAVPVSELRGALKGPRPKEVLALIGPEGDFTPAEARLAVSRGAVPVSLGKLVLRSETASLYLLSALNFFFGEASHDT
jgi:16S rRNA (uracil1498-N3)-methyltransferase